MSNGPTHDKVTIVLAPFIFVGAWYFIGWLALIVVAAFLFGGFAFNGDLDVKSQVYNRWFIFRWIWIPYQMYFTHRCLLTHGPFIGTFIRIGWIGILVVALLALFALFGVLPIIVPYILLYKFHFLLVFIGLELGSISHTFMDWASTGFKKIFN